MRNGYIIDTLTSVYNREIAKLGSEVRKLYEGVVYEKKLKRHILQRRY